jgi:hypothetical protein
LTLLSTLNDRRRLSADHCAIDLNTNHVIAVGQFKHQVAKKFFGQSPKGASTSLLSGRHAGQLRNGIVGERQLDPI